MTPWEIFCSFCAYLSLGMMWFQSFGRRQLPPLPLGLLGGVLLLWPFVLVALLLGRGKPFGE